MQDVNRWRTSAEHPGLARRPPDLPAKLPMFHNTRHTTMSMFSSERLPKASGGTCRRSFPDSRLRRQPDQLTRQDQRSGFLRILQKHLFQLKAQQARNVVVVVDLLCLWIPRSPSMFPADSWILPNDIAKDAGDDDVARGDRATVEMTSRTDWTHYGVIAPGIRRIGECCYSALQLWRSA